MLNSLPQSWSNFVMNYNMNQIEADPASLFNRLKTAENDMKNNNNGTVLMVSTHKPKKATKGKKNQKKKHVLKGKGGVKKERS